ncbi:hypothetical protein [Flocculibacter collagenilyticus]|nr:hypothetical protein [Flocculibacter collagenilyticus]
MRDSILEAFSGSRIRAKADATSSVNWELNVAAQIPPSEIAYANWLLFR